MEKSTIECSIWHFRAEGDPSKVHTVQENSGEYTCTCPVFTYSKANDCRHVRLVKNGLAGTPINAEPELAWGAVEHVQKYRGKVLVPFVSDEDQEGVYRTIWELRQLGLSKRRVSEFMGVRAVSDAVIETYLKSKDLLGVSSESPPRLSWQVSTHTEEVEAEGVQE